MASFQVVYPERCHRLYGCYATIVRAPERKVELTRSGIGAIERPPNDALQLTKPAQAMELRS